MRSRRLSLAITGLLLALLAGAAPAAQIPVPPPSPQTPVEREVPAEEPIVTRHRSIIRIAQDYTLPAGHVIPFVHTIFGDLTIDGEVDGDAIVTLGTARLGKNALIRGSLVVIGGSAVIDEGAAVRRDLVVIGGTVTSPQAFSPHGEHVVIGSAWFGEALQDMLPWVTRGLLFGRPIVPDLGWVWAIVGIFFGIYLVLNTVFERPVGASADVLVGRPLSAFLTGLLVLLLTVPALAIIAASVIGLAIVPFLLCAIVIVALVGKTAVCRALGRAVIRSESPEGALRAFLAFVAGFTILVLAYMVPVLGFVTWALTSVMGLGAASVTFRSYLRRERRVAVPLTAPAAAPAGVGVDTTPPAGDVARVSPPPSDVPPPPPVDPEIPPPTAFTQGLARYPRAAFLDRVAAFALDCILVAIANGLLDLSNDGGPFFLLLLVYHIAFWAWKGTTLGGIIINLRVVRTDGQHLRPADAIVRGLSSMFSIAALGIGCFWMLQDPERQMWHDKIAGTLVVKVPRDILLQ